jgi:hypothetical protein
MKTIKYLFAAIFLGIFLVSCETESIEELTAENAALLEYDTNSRTFTGTIIDDDPQKTGGDDDIPDPEGKKPTGGDDDIPDPEGGNTGGDDDIPDPEGGNTGGDDDIPDPEGDDTGGDDDIPDPEGGSTGGDDDIPDPEK